MNNVANDRASQIFWTAIAATMAVIIVASVGHPGGANLLDLLSELFK